MASGRLYTLPEADEILQTKDNRKLLRALIRHHGIPAYQVGVRGLALDDDGIALLRDAVAAWRNRPRITSPAAV